MEDQSMDKEKIATNFESRLSSFKRTKETLILAVERIQQLEVRLTGDKRMDIKNVAMAHDPNSNQIKSSIALDFADLTDSFNQIITDLNNSVDHLEEFI